MNNSWPPQFAAGAALGGHCADGKEGAATGTQAARASSTVLRTFKTCEGIPAMAKGKEEKRKRRRSAFLPSLTAWWVESNHS